MTIHGDRWGGKAQEQQDPEIDWLLHDRTVEAARCVRSVMMHGKATILYLFTFCFFSHLHY